MQRIKTDKPFAAYQDNRRFQIRGSGDSGICGPRYGLGAIACLRFLEVDGHKGRRVNDHESARQTGLVVSDELVGTPWIKVG